MKVTARVRFLNLFRSVFRIPMLEAMIRRMVQGKSSSHFYARLAPNPYQYPPNSLRTVVINGIKMTVDISDYLGHCLYFGFDGEESRSYQQLFSLVSKGDNVLDIGSNIGFTLLSMAHISEIGGVIGFEPDKLNYQRCLENVKQNNFQNIRLYNIGLGDNEISLPMEVRAEVNRGGNRVSVTGQGELIHIKTIDSIFPSFNLEKLDLVKIDVEGYELHVLKGGAKTLQKFHPVLFIEVNDDNLLDQNSSAKSLVEFLFDLGYNRIIRTDNGNTLTSSHDFTHCHFDIVANKT